MFFRLPLQVLDLPILILDFRLDDAFLYAEAFGHDGRKCDV